MRIIRTNSENKDFAILVKKLDLDLEERDGKKVYQSVYSQYNKIDQIKHVVIACFEDTPIACGAIKKYDDITMEIKRMYTIPKNRGQGIASKVLKELENWAKELCFERCILETGIRLPEAIKLYEKNQYSSIPRYGQYVKIKDSRCFEKIIKN